MTPRNDQQERLRALGLDASPAARRLRARIPRPVPGAEPAEGIPSAPYAVGAWPERDPHDRAPVPPAPDATRTVRTPPPSGRPPWTGARLPRPPVPTDGTTERLRPPRGRSVPNDAPSPTAGPRTDSADTGGAPRRHRVPQPAQDAAVPSAPGPARPRPVDTAGPGAGSSPSPWGGKGRTAAPRTGEEGAPRVPSGYTELLPRRDGIVARLAQKWPPEAALSRRAVAALLTVALAAVGTAVFLRERPAEAVDPAPVAHTLPAQAEPGAGPASPASPEADVVVHVGGKVEDPGVYTLPSGSRVADAVEAAGGALPDADTDLLNLARSLVDGEQILVGLPRPEAAAPPSGATGGPLVNINLADAAELDALPRVGEVTAGNIVSYREANGPFASVDDLINVDRIGARTLEEIRPHVTVG